MKHRKSSKNNEERSRVEIDRNNSPIEVDTHYNREMPEIPEVPDEDERQEQPTRNEDMLF